MQLATIGNEITMTSLELVQFINDYEGRKDLTHANFLAKVLKVLGEGGVIHFKDTYMNEQNGQIYPMYRFPKREACLMAMSYSYDLQAKVFDRMTELEQQQAPKLPQTFAEALRLLADSEEAKEKLALQVEQQRPAVEFVERYVEARSSKAISDVAKILGAKPQAFFTWLHESGIIFKRNGNWMPYSGVEHHFDVKTGEANGHAFIQAKFTPHGIAWISEKWNKANRE